MEPESTQKVICETLCHALQNIPSTASTNCYPGTYRQNACLASTCAGLQIALLAGAMTAYYSMKREPEDLQILVTRLWVPIVGIAAAVIVVPNLFLHERVPYEASSVGSLRTINTAEVEYARTHPDKGSLLRLPNWALIPPT